MELFTLLGRLSTKFWSVSVGNVVYSSRRTFVRSDTDIGLEDIAHRSCFQYFLHNGLTFHSFSSFQMNLVALSFECGLFEQG